jgi:hypothetical protein
VSHAHLWAFWETILHKTCDSLACNNLIGNSAWNLWKFMWKFWNCEAPSFTDFFINTLNKITHSLQMADHFTLLCEYLFTHLWIFYTIVLQFLHPLYFDHA